MTVQYKGIWEKEYDRWRAAFLVVLAMVLMPIAYMSCATPQKPATAQERLLIIYQIYNQQHTDYLNMAKMDNLTEGQKQMLRLKKPILEQLQVLIPAYDRTVMMGTPNQSQEQQIYDMLNQLQSMVPIN